jgi:hypothetical protein
MVSWGIGWGISTDQPVLKYTGSRKICWGIGWGEAIYPTYSPDYSPAVYVCQQIRSHDLSFLLDEEFPEIPDAHNIYECLKIIWQMTY